MSLLESWSEFCVWSLLGVLLLPAIGAGLSAMAGGLGRISRRPPRQAPGSRRRKYEKQTRNA